MGLLLSLLESCGSWVVGLSRVTTPHLLCVSWGFGHQLSAKSLPPRRPLSRANQTSNWRPDHGTLASPGHHLTPWSVRNSPPTALCRQVRCSNPPQSLTFPVTHPHGHPFPSRAHAGDFSPLLCFPCLREVSVLLSEAPNSWVCSSAHRAQPPP